MPTPPTAFISYSWDDETHKEWVRTLATRLRAGGVDVRLDHWHTVPRDQLPEFMEREIRENNYVIIVCTPKYKAKSEGRVGGVGYEGDIMTAEVLAKRNHRKFIPVLARGIWAESAPSWLSGKRYVDLSDASRYANDYQNLLATILGTVPKPPPLGPLPPDYEPPVTETFAGKQELILEFRIRKSPITSPWHHSWSHRVLRIPRRYVEAEGFSWAPEVLGEIGLRQLVLHRAKLDSDDDHNLALEELPYLREIWVAWDNHAKSEIVATYGSCQKRQMAYAERLVDRLLSVRWTSARRAVENQASSIV